MNWALIPMGHCREAQTSWPWRSRSKTLPCPAGTSIHSWQLFGERSNHQKDRNFKKYLPQEWYLTVRSFLRLRKMTLGVYVCVYIYISKKSGSSLDQNNIKARWKLRWSHPGWESYLSLSQLSPLSFASACGADSTCCSGIWPWAVVSIGLDFNLEKYCRLINYMFNSIWITMNYQINSDEYPLSLIRV
jgi:hypothetical protein